VREKTEEDAQRTTQAAAVKASQIVEEGEARRGQIEAVIAELEARRQNTIGELERLQAAVAATIADHRHDPLSPTRNADKRLSPAGRETRSKGIAEPSGS
jgi:hypothetical protein